MSVELAPDGNDQSTTETRPTLPRRLAALMLAGIVAVTFVPPAIELGRAIAEAVPNLP